MPRVPNLRSLLRRLTTTGEIDANRESVAVDLGAILEAQPWHLNALRTDDFLSVDFFLYNMKPDTHGDPAAVRKNPARPSYLVAQFQGQAFGEEAFEWSGNPATSQVPPAPPGAVAHARIAGPSRLAFKMPAHVNRLQLTFLDFLDACRTWPMSLDSLAAPLPAGFTDDLPVGGFLGTVFDSGVLSSAVASSVLSLAGFHEMRVGHVEALDGDDLAAIHRAAGLASRAVVARVKRDLASADMDEGLLAEFADAQVKAAATAAGVRAADRPVIRALVDLEVAVEVARPEFVAAGPLTVWALAKIPGILQLFLKPHKPALTVTSLELPYRLYLTPIEPAGWRHALAPVKRGSRTELWHTRLATKVGGKPDETAADKPMLRAIWSPDYKKNNPQPFAMPMIPEDRSDIVRLTAGFDEQTFKPDTEIPEPYIPKPVTSHRTILTALGAWLNSEGFWSRAPIDTDENGEATLLPTEAWRHMSAMGRDYYVRIIKRGFVHCLGHSASIITISERMFEDIPGSSDRAAYLRKFDFILIREPIRIYPGDGQKFGGRDFPFRKVEILTKVTPFLLPPGSDPGQVVGSLVDEANKKKVFWPMYDPGDGSKHDVKFKIRATDMSGREISFSMPLVFVRSDQNTTAILNQVNTAYGTDNRAKVPTNGQLIELVPQVVDGDTGGDTVMPVQSITFGGASPTKSLPPNRSRFFPFAAQMEVNVPALDQLAKFGKALTATYADVFKTNGFATPQNTGQVFLKIIGGDNNLGFGGSGAGSDGVGGLVAPNMTITAFSRNNGPVGGNENAFAGGNFDPADFFPSAKLFGTIDLKDIIAPVAVTLIGAAVPKLKKVEFPDRIEVGFEFKRENISSPLPILVTGAGGGTTLSVGAKTISYFTVDDPQNPIGNFNGSAPDPGLKDPEVIVDASLTCFKLNLFGCVIIWFDKLHFKMKAGEKPDVNPKLHDSNPVVFGGPLEFVNRLSEIIPSNGFSDPPKIDISPSGIGVGYSLAIPTVAVGIFSLQNMSIGALLRLPFDGDPVSIRFNFSERQKPFLLTVSLFGGGGFFALALDNSGVREVEAAFEFGAMAAINLGVASGSVYVKAGIYFHWKTDTVELEGYFEMGGEMSVLGIISVSLKFHLSLGYYKSNGKSEVKGQATLTVEIEILFFSASVSVTCERRLGGSDADPLFVNFYPSQELWDEYAAAFA